LEDPFVPWMSFHAAAERHLWTIGIENGAMARTLRWHSARDLTTASQG